MTVPTENGGPAFPFTCREDDGSNGPYGVDVTYRGMSLRDYFAGQALTAIIGQSSPAYVDEMVQGIKGGMREALAAYAWADAMLKARGQ